MFFIDENTVRVDLPGGEWVDIKAKMSIGDWEKYEASLLQYEAGSGLNRASRRRLGAGNDAPGGWKLAAGYLDLLEINIVRWSNPADVNRRNIARLDPDVARVIMAKIDELNPASPLAMTPNSSTPNQPLSTGTSSTGGRQASHTPQSGT